MDYMEFIKKNARAIVIAVLVVGVAGLAIVSQSNDNADQKTENQATEQPSAEQENKSEEKPAESGGVTKEESTYSTTVNSGDNQTVLVRKIIDRYLGDGSKTLRPEQKLYVETNLVNTLPRNDLIYAGQTIALTEESVKQFVDSSGQLTEAQLSRWARYL